MAEMKIQIGADVQQAVSGLNQVAVSANKTTGALAKLPTTSNQATNALSNLSRVAQDAPYGFIGIANNLNPLLESFQRLKVSTGSTGSALKEMAKGLTGPAGIGLAIGVVSSLLVAFGDKLFGAAAGMSRFAKIFSEAKDEFTKAYSTVATLNQQIQLAKDGFISKEGVVKKYNETIGKTTGLVKTLEEAELELTNKGDAFIRVTLQKAIATEAYKKSAEKLFQIELNNVRVQEESTNATGLYGRAQELAKQKIDSKNASLQRQSDLFKKIGDNANENAAVLSDLYKLNFQGDNKELKVPKIKVKPDKLEIRPAIGSIDLELPTAFDVPEISKLQKQINERFKVINATIPVNIDLSKPGKTKSGKQLTPEEKALYYSLGADASAAFASGFQSGFSAIGEGIGNILSGKKFGSGLTEALGGLLNALGQALIKFGIVKEGLDKLFGPGGIAIPGAVAIGLGALAIAAGTAIKNFGGFRAMGGPVSAGRSYIVGERGPEVFMPSSSGNIIPNGAGRVGMGNMAGLLGQVEFRISGNNLVGVLSAANRSQRRLA